MGDMIEVDFSKYQTIIGGAGWTRRVDYQLTDRVSVIHVNQVGVTLARATYYADEKPATFWLKKDRVNGG